MENGIVIKVAKPPMYERVLKAFGMTDQDVKDHIIIFAYKGIVWNPTGHHVTMDRLLHEAVHFKQQGDDPDGWWVRYIEDAQFRLEQEIEAYREQYRWAKKSWGDRNNVAKLLDFICKALSSNMYGNIISYAGARTQIQV